MKDTPLLMKEEMVNSTRKDIKSQTRRLNGLDKVNLACGTPHAHMWKYSGVESDGLHHLFEYADGINTELIKCPYGTVGDRLWVRETFWTPHMYPSDTGAGINGDDYKDFPPSMCKGRPIHYHADGNPPNTPNRTYPKGLKDGCGSFAAPDPYAMWHKNPSILERQL